MNNQEALKANLQYILDNRDELLMQYFGKYIVVNNQEIVGAYDSYENAVQDAIQKYGEEAGFLVHHLTKEETVNFVVRAQI